MVGGTVRRPRSHVLAKFSFPHHDRAAQLILSVVIHFVGLFLLHLLFCSTSQPTPLFCTALGELGVTHDCGILVWSWSGDVILSSVRSV